MDRATGSTYLQEADYEPIKAVYIFMSVSSCHRKANEVLDTSLPPSINTYHGVRWLVDPID